MQILAFVVPPPSAAFATRLSLPLVPSPCAHAADQHGGRSPGALRMQVIFPLATDEMRRLAVCVRVTVYAARVCVCVCVCVCVFVQSCAAC